ncbi:MAG: MBL fold metallo-hydrolase [Porticoccaceae bacterium]|nr:MBL fold metallo-hydrolase [Porticoccaceae bacterium]
MRFTSLGSGSKGNATLVEADDTCLLVDCGFSARELERRLVLVQREGSRLSAILVTHEHGDHIKGVWTLARRYQLTVYMSAGTARAVGAPGDVRLHLITPQQRFQVGAVEVLPVAVPHDAREPVQFVFNYAGLKLGVLTDLGHISAHVLACYQRCDALLVEANHDPAMLAAGSYPYALQQRVGGDWGHLNNGQTAALLDALEPGSLQVLMIGHISQQNNCLSAVERVMAPLTAALPQIVYASQDDCVDWLALE